MPRESAQEGTDFRGKYRLLARKHSAQAAAVYTMKRMHEVDPLIESLYRWSDVSGVLLMGIIGGTIARQRGYDIIGFFFIALFSSLGGGMIRDVLINRGTVAAMAQPE